MEMIRPSVRRPPVLCLPSSLITLNHKTRVAGNVIHEENSLLGRPPHLFLIEKCHGQPQKQRRPFIMFKSVCVVCRQIRGLRHLNLVLDLLNPSACASCGTRSQSRWTRCREPQPRLHREACPLLLLLDRCRGDQLIARHPPRHP